MQITVSKKLVRWWIVVGLVVGIILPVNFLCQPNVTAREIKAWIVAGVFYWVFGGFCAYLYDGIKCTGGDTDAAESKKSGHWVIDWGARHR
ncbi:MAG: hypothetical protein KGJ93_01155 [Patescibacteria group bacterium]|nr:hypothetical protein [Patescibacteria group bacterium]